MGNRHPELQNINSLQNIQDLLKSFNNLDQTNSCRYLGYIIKFDPTQITTRFYQPYSNGIVNGRIIADKIHTQPIQKIALNLNSFLELRDMIVGLVASSTGGANSTPGGPRDEKEQCCLCLDKNVELMLPCSHAYCSECLDKYVLKQEQKKCPQCRVQYKQSRNKMRKRLACIMDDDEEANQMLVSAIGELLTRNNPQIRLPSLKSLSQNDQEPISKQN